MLSGARGDQSIPTGRAGISSTTSILISTIGMIRLSSYYSCLQARIYTLCSRRILTRWAESAIHSRTVSRQLPALNFLRTQKTCEGARARCSPDSLPFLLRSAAEVGYSNNSGRASMWGISRFVPATLPVIHLGPLEGALCRW